jgi:hypothetical protein
MAIESDELPKVGRDRRHEKKVADLVKSAKQQSAKFAEAARDLGLEDSGDQFDRNLRIVASAPPPKSVKKRKAKAARRAR